MASPPRTSSPKKEAQRFIESTLVAVAAPPAAEHPRRGHGWVRTARGYESKAEETRRVRV